MVDQATLLTREFVIDLGIGRKVTRFGHQCIRQSGRWQGARGCCFGRNLGASGTGCAFGEAPAISFSGKGVGKGVGKGMGSDVLGSGAGKASEAMAVMPAGGMNWASLEAAAGRGLGCACGLG